MEEDLLKLQAGGKEIVITKARLKLWIDLNSIQKDVLVFREADKLQEMVEKILEYLVKASGEESDIWNSLPWMECAHYFSQICNFNKPSIDLPIFHKPSKEASTIPWEYPNREWYSTLHMLSSAYGWEVEYIANLAVNTAFALIQEILTTEQLHREWEWQMSEIAYPYNSTLKKSQFKPLPRPEWMLAKVEIKKIRMPRSLLPVGNVIDLSGLSLGEIDNNV